MRNRNYERRELDEIQGQIQECLGTELLLDNVLKYFDVNDVADAFTSICKDYDLDLMND